MVSGTYVLTDTIKAAFSTVFTTVYKHSDAVVTGKSAIGTNNRRWRGGNALHRSLPASLLTRVQQLPGVAQASGGISDQRAADRARRQGDLARRGAGPRVQLHAERPALQSADADQRQLAKRARARWRSTLRPASKEQLFGRPDDRRDSSGSGAAVQDLGIVKFGGVSSLGGATMAVFTAADRAAAVPQAGALTRSTSPPPTASSPTQLVGEIRPLLPPSAQVRTGQAAGPAGDEGHQRVPHHLPGLPARVRRDRAVRRQLRDREHAVDHDRPAHAGARDAADPRRDPPPGAALGDARGVGDRAARLGRGPVPWAGAREGPEPAVRLVRDRPAAGRHGVRHADDRRVAAGRGA